MGLQNSQARPLKANRQPGWSMGLPIQRPEQLDVVVGRRLYAGNVTSVRRFAVLEPAAVFALIVAYIWELRRPYPILWLPILGLMVVSHLARRERAEALGFRRANLRECFREFAPALAFLALLLLAGGLLCGTLRPVGWDNALASLALYLPWGLLQQYILNGYFFNRIGALASRRAAPLIAAGLFAGVHLPNWFLMGVTLVAGYGATRVYRRYRNLYFLGIAHAAVGILLFLVVPDSISHHLNVGPGWFRH